MIWIIVVLVLIVIGQSSRIANQAQEIEQLNDELDYGRRPVAYMSDAEDA